jgi:hypothetical protein
VEGVGVKPRLKCRLIFRCLGLSALPEADDWYCHLCENKGGFSSLLSNLFSFNFAQPIPTLTVINRLISLLILCMLIYTVTRRKCATNVAPFVEVEPQALFYFLFFVCWLNPDPARTVTV